MTDILRLPGAGHALLPCEEMLAAVPATILVTDPDMRIIDGRNLPPSASLKELRGRSVVDLVVPGQQEAWAAYLACVHSPQRSTPQSIRVQSSLTGIQWIVQASPGSQKKTICIGHPVPQQHYHILLIQRAGWSPEHVHDRPPGRWDVFGELAVESEWVSARELVAQRNDHPPDDLWAVILVEQSCP